MFICFLILWYWIDHGISVLVHNQKEIMKFLEHQNKKKDEKDR